MKFYFKSLFCLVILFSFFISSAVAEEWRNYKAVSVIYVNNAPSKIKNSTFKSKISIFTDGAFRIIQIKNYLKPGSKYDSLIKISDNGTDVGSLIYNSNNKVIAEYSGGKIWDKNYYSFSKKIKEGLIHADWFIGKNSMMSDFSMQDKSGRLLYKETVVYSARHKK